MNAAQATEHLQRPEIQNHRLYLLLLTSVRGKSILKGFQSRGYLKKTLKSKLTREIITDEIERNFHNVLRAEGREFLEEFTIPQRIFLAWRTEIVEVFPGEDLGTYYRPYARVENNRVAPGGRLYNHYAYRRGTLIEDGLLRPRRQRQQNGGAEPAYEIPENEEDLLTWLETHLEPEETVKANWRATYRGRRLLCNTTSINEYYNRFPSLENPTLGAELLKADFNVEYQAQANEFFERWPIVRNFMCTLVKDCSRVPLNDRPYADAVVNLLDGKKDIIIFYLLPFLLDLPRKRKAGDAENQEHERRRITSVERREAFLLHIENQADVNAAVNRYRDNLAAARQTFQPTPVIVGPLLDIQSIFVLVNETRYEVPSMLHAIDVCFKVFFALNCKYSERAALVWQFIQKGLFDIHLPSDKENNSVRELIGYVALKLIQAQAERY